MVAVGKRTGKYQAWEPIFIGTHSDPLYDERLSWEGRSDKMTHVKPFTAFIEFSIFLSREPFHFLDLLGFLVSYLIFVSEFQGLFIV